MAKREANKRKRKAADDAPEGGPSGDGDSGLRSIDQDKNYMMRLPSELLIEILSYIVRQGDTIEMRDGKPTPERRNWNAEAKKLKDPTWKKPKPSLMPRNFAVCKELYRCGVKAFWGGNTFSFTTPGDLQQFNDVATTRARERVKSIALFRDYAISLAQSLAPPGIPAPGPWPQWPPSQVLLSALPNLQTLDICTTSINQRKALPTVLDNLYDSETQDNPAHVRHLGPPLKMPEDSTHGTFCSKASHHPYSSRSRVSPCATTP